ncbi:general odorant-binding protein 71 [Wyeomyia smithii]|uniref:general odorant-binding protein 71 n=1 Tax=Wyeomyia smithii TaxID=174621 RepID=UPI002467C63D|nr:general odorant-binding protein 71 [Wyeomyia smithii]
MTEGRGRLPMALMVVLVCIVWPTTTALKCRTEDGPTSDEVRKVVRTCMKRISSESDNKTQSSSSSNEYENYDSSADDDDSDDEKKQPDGRQNRTGTQRNSKSNRGDSRNRGRNNNDHSNSNRNRMDGGRNRDWDYGNDMGRRNDGGRMSNGRYKRQYYNDGTQDGYGYSYQQNDRYNRDRNNFLNPTDNSSKNATENEDRDRACLMQCFFQEMKMTNSEGFPDQHKVLHVVTKDLRDKELRDFYTDSIQECFHMISMDSKLKDKCDYTMKFVICLADRGQANCKDWEHESIMF